MSCDMRLHRPAWLRPSAQTQAAPPSGCRTPCKTGIMGDGSVSPPKRRKLDSAPALEGEGREGGSPSSMSDADTTSTASKSMSQCKQCGKTLPSSLQMCHACWFNEVSVISQLARFHSKAQKSRESSKEASPKLDAAEGPGALLAAARTADGEGSASSSAPQHDAARRQ